MNQVHRSGRRWALGAAALAGALLAALAHAEPYLAVRAGAKCMTCHTNPTGGGKRTEYGATYGSTVLAAGSLGPVSGATAPNEAPGIWTGKINDYLALGADARMNLDSTDIPNQEDTLDFRLRSTQLYLEFQLVPNRLSLYVDEHVAPGGASNREAFMLLWSQAKNLYLKAGRFFLPYGLRLEDDSAFIRQTSGINFNSSDNGVEGGLEMGPWSAQLAVSNGTAGGAENNREKQFSLLGSFVQSLWRVGASYNANKGVGAERTMQNVFGGLRTGPVAWLGEVDYIEDESATTGRNKQRALLFEANVEMWRGHNLKLTYEHLDPDRDVDDDERERFSAVWEYVPFQYTQFRLGYRDNQGPRQINLNNANELFAQWHAFF